MRDVSARFPHIELKLELDGCAKYIYEKMFHKLDRLTSISLTGTKMNETNTKY